MRATIGPADGDEAFVAEMVGERRGERHDVSDRAPRLSRRPPVAGAHDPGDDHAVGRGRDRDLLRDGTRRGSPVVVDEQGIPVTLDEEVETSAGLQRDVVEQRASRMSLLGRRGQTYGSDHI